MGFTPLAIAERLEHEKIEARILASGLSKKDYFVCSCIYNQVCMVGKKELIEPICQLLLLFRE